MQHQEVGETGQRTILQGGTVLTMDPDDRGPLSCDIAIDGSRIVEFAPDITVSDCDDVINATGMLILPGLINAHIHSSEAFFKGRYDRLTFDAWGLYAYPLLATAPMTPSLVRLRTLIAGIEALKSGVTFVIDDVADEISGQALDRLAAVFGVYRELGIRATCSGNVMNRHALETLPAVGAVPLQVQEILSLPLTNVPDYLEFCAEAHRRFHEPNGRLRYMVAPVAPQWCTSDMLIAAHDFAVRHGLQFHTHVLETKAQALIAQNHFGGSLINYLADLGVLTSRTNLIHAVWTSTEEISAIGESGASVVHNPHSNLKLGSGLAPFMRYLHGEIPIGLGTDGLASSDTTRLFEAVRLALLVHRLGEADPKDWPSAFDVLHAATVGGAKVAQMDTELGLIKAGMRADLIMLDGNSVNLTPLNDAYTQLGFCEDGSSVRHVMVDGEFVVRDRTLTRVDEAEIRSEVDETVSAYLREHRLVENRHRPLERYMTEIDIAAGKEFDRRRSIGCLSVASTC